MVHLEKSRSVLNDFQIALVSVAAVLIILVNGLLCVFLVRDSRLWQLVRFDCLGESFFIDVVVVVVVCKSCFLFSV